MYDCIIRALNITAITLCSNKKSYSRNGSNPRIVENNVDLSDTKKGGK